MGLIGFSEGKDGTLNVFMSPRKLAMRKKWAKKMLEDPNQKQFSREYLQAILRAGEEQKKGE